MLKPVYFDEIDLRLWEEQLWNDGCLVIRNALSAEAVAHFLGRTKEIEAETTNLDKDAVRKQSRPLPARGYDFVELFAGHDPIRTLARRILGPDMHLWLMAAHIMRKSKTISTWHADDIYLQRPPHVADSVPFPPIVNVLNCHYYLVDVPMELGPTEVVPTSHRACRQPVLNGPHDVPEWMGRKPVSFTVRAGDLVVYSNHCWHRGAPITSEGTRYSLVAYYARRFIQQRWRDQYRDLENLNGNIERQKIPETILAQCSPDELEVLGYHEKVPYDGNALVRNMRWVDGRPVGEHR